MDCWRKIQQNTSLSLSAYFLFSFQIFTQLFHVVFSSRSGLFSESLWIKFLDLYPSVFYSFSIRLWNDLIYERLCDFLSVVRSALNFFKSLFSSNTQNRSINLCRNVRTVFSWAAVLSMFNFPYDIPICNLVQRLSALMSLPFRTKGSVS